MTVSTDNTFYKNIKNLKSFESHTVMEEKKNKFRSLTLCFIVEF